MEKDKLKIKGSINVMLHKANGDVIARRRDNLILTAGFDFICDALAGTSRPAIMAYTAVGTGTTAVEAGQTALVTELKRKAAAYAHTAGTHIFTLTTTFAAGEATGAITEAGICNASSGGTFLDRVTFDVINKAADDTMTTTFQFTLS
ncbi:hypothetical protein NXG27_00890 [Megasphaera paucivorans]|uniref:Uncharacterized protein n=1 Tax=Megasphaera paucivorans TaxID=349095 RepID=A0A1G9QBH2_9FIRM|nr:hypothetical protein [Megasphaera paucivorans]SDM08414.1 hypothetical protein SAMN05660299_00180 [Megasphaera paucivorans]